METTKRHFVIGDEWLYFKIYTRIYFADKILVKLNYLCNQLLTENIINKWFFIRFNDPGFHVRFRVKLNNFEDIPKVIEIIKKYLKIEIDDELIDLKINTYAREMERYDDKGIEHAEELFFYDSMIVSSIVENINNRNFSEEDRWLFGVSSINELLNDFNFSVKEKLDLMQNLDNEFSMEFGKNKNLNKQLDKKYREYSEKINSVMNLENPYFKNLLSERSRYNKPVINNLKKCIADKIITNEINDLLSSYIHMNCNRLFRINPRKHEYVLYDFLNRYYKKEFHRKK